MMKRKGKLLTIAATLLLLGGTLTPSAQVVAESITATTTTQPDPAQGTISGTTWHDTNNNGTRDPDEPALADVELSLYSADDKTKPLSTEKTGTDGTYSFTALQPGDYVLSASAQTIAGTQYQLPEARIDQGNQFAAEQAAANAPDTAFTGTLTIGEDGSDLTGNDLGMRTAVVDVITDTETNEVQDNVLNEVLDEVPEDTTGNYTVTSEDLNESFDTLAEAFEAIHDGNDHEYTVTVNADDVLTETIDFKKTDSDVTLTSNGEAKTLTQDTPGLRHFNLFRTTNMTIENVILDGNGTGGGIGISGVGGRPTNLFINSGAIIQNCLADNGGGVKIDGVDNSVVVGSGGAIINNKALVAGGGVYAANENIVIIDGSIDGNSADGAGGGVYVGSAGYLATRSGADFANNTAGTDGGAIFYEDETFRQFFLNGNPAFTGNTAGNGIKYDSSFEDDDRLKAASTSLPDFSNTNPVNNYDVNSFTQEVMNYTVKDETYGETDYYSTLKEAFAAINADSDEPTNGKEYTITANANETMAATATFERMVAVTLTSSGTAKTITQTDGRHIDTSAGNGSLTLKNIVLDGGNTGGGISVRGRFDKLTLGEGASIQNCRSTSGGGVYAYLGATVNVTSGSISRNEASSAGGGIYALGATVNVTSGSISDNEASYGGGVYAYSGSAVNLTDGSISRNEASSVGGGIYALRATVNVISGSISNNEASSGGGVYAYSGSAVNLTDGSISGNKSSSEGGGIYTSLNSAITISEEAAAINFADNTAIDGGAIYTADSNYNNIELNNKIIFTGNTAGSINYDKDSGLISASTSIPGISTSNPANNYDVNADGQEYYTVTYHYNDGTASSATETVYAQAQTSYDVAELTSFNWTAPEDTGFCGWNTKADGTGTIYLYSAYPTTINSLRGNTDLYARWGYAFAITAGTGGSIASSHRKYYPKGEKITVTAEPMTNFTFDKWETADGSGSFANAGRYSTVFTMPDSAAELTASFRFMPQAANLSSPSGGDRWYNDQDKVITLTAPEGCLISADGSTGWSERIDVDDSDGIDKTADYYLKDTATGVISGKMTSSSYKVDKTAPTGEIRIRERVYKSGEIPEKYDLFARDSVEVEIVIDDDLSGVDTIHYKVRSDFIADWQTYTGPFTLPARQAAYVLTDFNDIAGNWSQRIHSEYIVVYNDSTIDPAHQSAAYTKQSGTSLVTPINLNGNILKDITLDGEQVSGIHYDMDGISGELSLNHYYLDSLPPGEHELILSYHPLGFEFVSETWNDEPATNTITLTIQRADNAITGVDDVEVTYNDGAAVQLTPAFAGPVPFRFITSDENVVQADEHENGYLTFMGAGEAEITISGEETDDYNRVEKTINVKVNKAENMIEDVEDVEATYGDDSFTLAPNAEEAPTFSFASDDETVATVEADTGVVTIAGFGVATITVTSAETANYRAAETTVTVKVNKAQNTITDLFDLNRRVGDAAESLNPQAEESPTFSYRTSAAAIAAVNEDGELVVGTQPGMATITVESSETANFLPATASFTVNVTDPEALLDLMALAEALDPEDYTKASWQAVKEALAAAENILATEDAVQGEMQAALDSLQEALDSLRRVYVFTEAFGTFAGTGDLTGTINGELEDFLGLWIDGEEVAPDNYTAMSGSTVITLKESYLKTLANGTYSLSAAYTDGRAATTLTVDVKAAAVMPDTGADSTGNTDSNGGSSSLSVISGANGKQLPQTGETAVNLTLMGMLLLGAWLLFKRRRREDQLELE